MNARRIAVTFSTVLEIRIIQCQAEGGGGATKG